MQVEEEKDVIPPIPDPLGISSVDLRSIQASYAQGKCGVFIFYMSNVGFLGYVTFVYGMMRPQVGQSALYLIFYLSFTFNV